MITNRELVRFRDVVFANRNKDIQREVTLAGREDEFATYQRVFQLGGPQIVTVTGALGSGKTFLLTAGRQAFLKRSFPEQRNRHQAFATYGGQDAAELRRHFADADNAHRRLLELEELDRKGAFPDLMRALDGALAWLADSHDGMLAVIGDLFVTHPEVQAKLKRAGIPVTAIELPPLDQDLLTKAIELRLGQLHLDGGPPEPAAARRAAEEILGDDQLERALIPGTSPPTANFREALGLLKDAAEHVSRSEGAVSFPASVLPKLVKRGHKAPPEPLRRVDDEVRKQVVSMFRTGEAIEPISAAEVRDLTGSDKVGRHFHDSIIVPLVNGQILEPMGTPYCPDGEPDPDIAYVGPFLPRQRAILRAYKSIAEPV